MADSEVKIRITTDASGAITGFKTVRDEVDKTEKQSAGLVSKIKAHWLGLSAAVTAASVTVYKAWDLASGAANYIEAMQNLSGLAAAYGTTATEITSKIQSIGDGMLSMATSAEVAYSGLAKNLKPDMLYGLAKAATVLNDSMGMTADEAFSSMASALELNKQKSLKLAVGTIDLKERYGDLASKMSEAEKQSAFYNLIMEKTNEISTRLGSNTKSIADEMEAFQATVSNLKTELGIGLIRAGAGVIGMFQWLAAGVLTATSVFPRLLEYVSLANAKIYEWTGQTGRMKAAVADAKSLGKAADDMLGAAGELTGKAAGNFSLMVSSTADLVKARGKAVATGTDRPTGVGSSKDDAKAAAERERLLDAHYKHELEIAKAVSDAEDDLIKAAADGYKTTMDSINKSIKERGEAARDLYKDMRGYEEEYYNESVSLIADQAARFRAAGLDEIAIAKYVEEQKRLAKLQQSRTVTGGDFAAGWSQGAEDWVKDLGNDFTQAEKMAKSTANSMSSSFSTVFFDAAKGDMQEFKSYFSSFLDSMLKSYTNMLADMLTKWIMNMNMMQAAQSGFNWFTTVLGGVINAVSAGVGGSGALINDSGSLANVTAESVSAFNFHTGGIVGQTFNQSMMPAYAFAGAPRFHRGFAPDEFPAILQRGEAVIPKNKVNPSAAAPGAEDTIATITNNTFNISAVDAKSFTEMCKRNPDAIVGPMMASMKNNKTRTDMRSLLK